MVLHRIDLKTARPFIEQWHYSKRVPTGRNIFFGWFYEDSALLYAVSNYGIGVNPYQYQFLERELGIKYTQDTLLELKRLCRIEPRVETAPLTQFLAQCHRSLVLLGVRAIISFSDPEQGHTGGIYKAANFQHLGVTNPEWHLVDAQGVKRHRRFAFRYARRKGISIANARRELGLSRVQTKPKDRWFLRLK